MSKKTVKSKLEADQIQIFLNSKSAVKYGEGGTSDCYWNIPNIDIPRSNAIFMSVLNASIPYSFFNIDTYDNKLYYTISGKTTVLEIPQGNYSVLTLRDYLNANMTGFTWVYLSTSNQYQITHASTDFIFNKESTIFELLGFDDKADYTSSAKVLKSSIMCNFFPIRQILMQSFNILNSNINASTPNNACIICSIPVTTQANGIIQYVNNGSTKFRVDHLDNISELRITLCDQDGDYLDLNGSHWSATLQIDIQ